MMMVTEMTDQKRRNHYDPFHLSPKRVNTEPLEGNDSFPHKVLFLSLSLCVSLSNPVSALLTEVLGLLMVGEEG